jgi:hypothetical protein
MNEHPAGMAPDIISAVTSLHEHVHEPRMLLIGKQQVPVPELDFSRLPPKKPSKLTIVQYKPVSAASDGSQPVPASGSEAAPSEDPIDGKNASRCPT